MISHGKDVSFQDWAEDEGLKHGDMPIMEWAEHEEESHDERYGAESFSAETSYSCYGDCGAEQDWNEGETQPCDCSEFLSYGLCAGGCSNEEVSDICPQCDKCVDSCCVYWNCVTCNGKVCVNEPLFSETLETMQNLGVVSSDRDSADSVCTECYENVMWKISEEVGISDPPTQEEVLRVIASGQVWRPEDIQDLADDALNQTDTDWKWAKYLKRFGAETFEAGGYQVTCSKCGEKGHNKASCGKNPDRNRYVRKTTDKEATDYMVELLISKAKRNGYIMGISGAIVGWFINNQFFCRK